VFYLFFTFCDVTLCNNYILKMLLTVTYTFCNIYVLQSCTLCDVVCFVMLTLCNIYVV
jgi:hypothetical protein